MAINERLAQIVDKTIMEADKDRDGKISFEEFTKMVENTDVSMSMTLGTSDFHGRHLDQITDNRLLCRPILMTDTP